MNAFLDDQRRIAETLALADHVVSKTGGLLDSSEVLRGAFVSVLSSLDLFVHSRVRQEVIRQYTSGSMATKAGRALPVSLGHVRSADQDPSLGWLHEAFQQKCGHLSFQDPSKISGAVSLVRDSSGLWDSVQQSCDVANVKLQLKLQVDRRNQMVHESDRQPTDPSTLWTIDAATVWHAVAVVTAAVIGIDAYIADSETIGSQLMMSRRPTS